ncbi:hypothetical protein, partial [Streptosporangium amethystogenes]|uniref:hypothetical protein n=1 Tax=Streptosporangium amethystogenes TaxID=2002 RepID=UPI0031D1C00F
SAGGGGGELLGGEQWGVFGGLLGRWHWGVLRENRGVPGESRRRSAGASGGGWRDEEAAGVVIRAWTWAEVGCSQWWWAWCGRLAASCAYGG